MEAPQRGRTSRAAVAPEGEPKEPELGLRPGAFRSDVPVPVAVPIAAPMMMAAPMAPMAPMVPTHMQPMQLQPMQPMQGVVLAQAFVVDLGFEIQRGFRRKMLSILLMQLCLSLFVGLVLRFAIPLESFILVLFPAGSAFPIILGAICLGSLPILSCVREKHPWNFVCTTIWSFVWGVFLAASQVPDGFIGSNTLFTVFGATTIGVAALLVCSTSFSYTDRNTGERRLWSFNTCGWVGFLLMLLVSIIIFTQVDGYFEHGGHFIGGMIMASILFAWVTYDANKLCKTMQPDDYMKGVIYFYTDFLYVCCCCLLLGCLGGGGGGGGS